MMDVFNLQTFPIDFSEWIMEDGDDIALLKKWKEGFEKKLRDELFLIRVRCVNCAESDEQFCEICAKEILEER